MNQDQKGTSHAVTIYTSPTCHYCHMAKDYFAEHKVPYTEVDLSIEQDRVMEMVQKSGQMGVPVIEIDSTVVVGFRPDEFERLLA